MRSYELSNTIMGKRYAQDTVRYNRYGYELYPGIRRAFDTLGRITDWQWMSHHKRVQEGHVEYSAEGLVEYYRFSEFTCDFCKNRLICRTKTVARYFGGGDPPYIVMFQ